MFVFKMFIDFYYSQVLIAMVHVLCGCCNDTLLFFSLYHYALDDRVGWGDALLYFVVTIHFYFSREGLGNLFIKSFSRMFWIYFLFCVGANPFLKKRFLNPDTIFVLDVLLSLFGRQLCHVSGEKVCLFITPSHPFLNITDNPVCPPSLLRVISAQLLL